MEKLSTGPLFDVETVVEQPALLRGPTLDKEVEQSEDDSLADGLAPDKVGFKFSSEESRAFFLLHDPG